MQKEVRYGDCPFELNLVVVQEHLSSFYTDISILNARVEEHKTHLIKGSDEEDEDDYESSEEYPEHWEIISRKGYQGAAEILRAIPPRKKPIRGIFGRDNVDFN